MNHYKKGVRYFSPAAWILAAGGFLLFYSAFLGLMKYLNHSDVFSLNLYLVKASAISMAMAAALLTLSLALHIKGGAEKQIEHRVKKRLYDPVYGNPLSFREGELLPPVRCRRLNSTTFEISVRAVSCTVENLLNIAPVISSSLNGKYGKYAVVSCEADEAFNRVAYRIEDVLADRSLTVNSVEGLKSPDKTKIPIDMETFIDLKTSGSILVAGKTRSGKTTGTITILLPLLLCGRDKYDSNIFIIDPKLAELSMLPHVVAVNPNGDVEPVIALMEEFESTRKTRQAVLNRRSQETGNAVKWWDAGMHPSILFIDEYVALKSLFPKSARGNGGFNISDFESLLKRIITMGASAGCFVIISIAEASVEEGGLPSMLKSAMTTKILFKPTVEEARLIWNSERLRTFNAGRAYRAGDCLFSSTDGIHDTPGYLHFPNMEFEVYAELGRLLEEYYAPEE